MLDGGEPAVAEFHRAAQALADIQRASVLPEERTSEFALVLRVSALPSTEAKLIAAQAIPQYVGLFPAMIEDAFNAQLDLCEDDSVQVRIESIRNLPLFCKSKPEFASRISDVLCQLLKQGLTKELVVIRSTFLQTLTDYPVSVKGIFRPLRQDSIEVRRAILAFFKESPDALPRDVELAAQFAASMIELISAVHLDQEHFDTVVSLIKAVGGFNNPESYAPIIHATTGWFAAETPLDPHDRTLVSKLVAHANRCLGILQVGGIARQLAGGPSDEIIALVSDGLVKTGRFAEMELAQLLNLLKLVADLSRFLRTAQEPVLFLLNETDRISAHSLAFSEPVQVRLRCLVAESLRIKQSLSAQIVETGRASSNPASMDIDSLPPTIRKSMNVAENVQAISTQLLKPPAQRQDLAIVGSWKHRKHNSITPRLVHSDAIQIPESAVSPQLSSAVPETTAQVTHIEPTLASAAVVAEPQVLHQPLTQDRPGSTESAARDGALTRVAEQGHSATQVVAARAPADPAGPTPAQASSDKEREKRLQSFGPDGKASKKSEAAPHVVSPRLAQQAIGQEE
ncbi:hypothetical protein HK105_205972 [Polyrhizophydium stewartii]|uniref:Uncharacterized protein n=1 Tax=Polyrhizophydium stewartii TaxID=2732419 RepID=A0ABR4N4L2_9FUNG